MIYNFVLTSILSLVVSVILGSYLSLRLPSLHRFLDHKPFNCFPCLSFHLCWFFQAVYAVASRSFLYLPVGIAIAFGLFLVVRYIDNKKIEE